MEVALTPMLLVFSIFQPDNVDDLYFHRPAGWLDPEYFSRMSGENSFSGGHLVAYCYLVEDLDPAIGKPFSEDVV